MSTTSPNYGYILPDDGESVEIGDLRTNFSAIDGNIKNANDLIAALGAFQDVTSKVVWRDGTNPIAIDVASSYSARIMRLGKLRVLSVQLTSAGSQAFGSGAYAWALDATLSADYAKNSSAPGFAILRDSSPFTEYTGTVFYNTGNVFRIAVNGNRVASTIPFTWAVGDSYSWTTVYEAV